MERQEFHDKFLPEPNLREGVKLLRMGSDVFTNVPHLVVHHSPDGFEWGYGGSGPTDLALNILENYLKIISHQGERVQCYDGDSYRLAWDLRLVFKAEFVAGVDREGGFIPAGLIIEWIKKNQN